MGTRRIKKFISNSTRKLHFNSNGLLIRRKWESNLNSHRVVYPLGISFLFLVRLFICPHSTQKRNASRACADHFESGLLYLLSDNTFQFESRRIEWLWTLFCCKRRKIKKITNRETTNQLYVCYNWIYLLLECERYGENKYRQNKILIASKIDFPCRYI